MHTEGIEGDQGGGGGGSLQKILRQFDLKNNI